MRRTASFLGIGLCAVGIATVIARTAGAGNRSTPQDVYVQMNADGSGFAFGAQGDVRNSGKGTGTQDIGCLTWMVPGAALIGCSATDTSGTPYSCWASSSFLQSAGELISSITSDSYIYFSWDTNGNCSGLSIYNSSRYQPKQFFASAP